ncbi:AAA family ATPase, partial [Streptomyces sp. NPDC005573]|uniref:AAA family ATPase n=1 Tax=Streptomyces sp. NPDC005573 TaxID=3156890 RepID=UPI0033BC393D
MAVRTDSGSFPGVAVSAADRTDTHVVGWDRELTETGHCLRAPGGPRLVLVRGERGAGRSAFAHAVAAGLRADGVEVLALTCVAGDEAHPLLLALRLTALARERRPATGGQRAAGGPGAEALAAVERGDRAVLADALRAALAHVSPVVVVVDDAQYADAASLAVLRGISTGRSAADVRLLLTVLRHDAVADSLPTELPHGNGPLEPVATGTTPHTIVLPRLAPGVVAELVALRVKAAPDTLLARQAHRLTRGIPAVVEALLTGWSRQGAIRVADGHAFLDTGSAVPALPDDDRCLAALHATGEPCRTVAGALSVLWPLGRRAAALVARSTGLSGKEVDHGIRHLVAEGILDELHAADGAPVRGWRFRAPLVEHAVRERLGPLERRRLSAAAVEAVWATQDSADAGDGEPGAPALVEEADARTYLPDRIADAGSRVDRERAVRELSSAAQRLHPDPEGLGMLRWLRAALRLVEEPATRQLALLRYAKAAYVTGDHLTVRNAAQALLRSPDEGVTAVMLQDAASLLVGSIAAEDGRPRLSRMASPQWWESLRLPDLAVVPGRVLALCLAEKWQEALDLLAATEGVWDTDPLGRLLPRLYRSVAELVSGRPERFERDLALPMGGLPPDTLYAVTLVQVDRLLDARDLSGATALLAGRGLDHGSLPPYTRFLVSHLQGRWDDALERARRMVAHH